MSDPDTRESPIDDAPTASGIADPDAAEAAGRVDTPDASGVALGVDQTGAEAVPQEISEEAVVALIAERDEYLDALQRIKAEFANARRRTAEQATAQREQAAAGLVEKLLPILDSCEAALAQGLDDVAPISSALFDVLAGHGLTRVDPTGELFDPEQHEAVLHESGDGEPTVSETLRTGYRLHERVLRPAMVKVQG